MIHKQLIFYSRFEVMHIWQQFTNMWDLRPSDYPDKHNKSFTNIKSNMRKKKLIKSTSCNMLHRRHVNKAFQNKLRQYIIKHFIHKYKDLKKIKVIKFGDIQLFS